MVSNHNVIFSTIKSYHEVLFFYIRINVDGRAIM